MKTRKLYEHEYQFHGTPAQFLAYLRRQAKKHPGELCNDFSLREFSRPSQEWDSKYSEALPSEHPCQSEIVVTKPYEDQTYIRNFDGSVYNEIMEFSFDDDKTGFGYYYTVQIHVDDEDREANAAELVAAIAARRAAKADRQEAQAKNIDAFTDRKERTGYADPNWVYCQRTEAQRLRREAAETRAAIEAAKTFELV